MKENNNLFKELKNEFNKIEAPDLKDQIKAKYFYSKNIVEEKQKVNLKTFNIRTLMSSLIGTLSIFIFVLIIIISSKPINRNPVITGSKNIITFEAVSAISLMPNTSQINLNDFSLEPLSFTQLYMSENQDKKVEDIHKYLPLIEQVLSIQDQLNITSEVSDRQDYVYKDLINITTSLGQLITYTFYYNTTNLVNNEEEQEFELNGIMIYNNLEYSLTGTKSIEDDESQVSILAELNENTWVMVEQQKENNEEEYEFKISDNGIITNSKMKIENKNNKIEVELEYSNEVSRGKFRFSEETEDNKTRIKVQVHDGKEVENFKVCIVKDETTGKEVYEYKHEKGEVYRKENRFHHGEDDDDDEDEEDDDVLEEEKEENKENDDNIIDEEENKEDDNIIEEEETKDEDKDLE